MTSLFERLDEEEAIVRGELAALRDKVAQAEERLARLAITRDTAASLLGREPGAGSREPGSSQPSGAADAVPSEPDGPEGTAGFEGGGPELEELPLEVAQERILALLAQAGRAVRLQDIVPAIGESRVETTRSRLKAMAKKGLLIQGPTAWFRLAPADTEEGATTADS
ncbi:hypothetical protein [Streptomyces nigrescens]|uniref:MarR family transcriptional regulator n=1 Tax=Streptomyces nigrescens TaxID=1920 RepID=A0ABY7J8T9_STRNI|nr:hypothetical protein [Streptomyces nigrescens]WAU06487.1 hypothetical protein STRNI_004995 [Streptomyces nigrescens]